MSKGPVFSLTRNGEPIRSIELSPSLAQGSDIADVNEAQPYGFEIDGREPDLQFGVWIGDISTGVSTETSGSMGTAVGVALGRSIIWADTDCFQGARGLVWVRLASRHTGPNRAWKDRALLPVVVTSTKLSEDRYNIMYEQLRGLAAGLVLDLVSKTLRSMRLGGRSKPIAVRSSLVELRILEQAWPPIARAIKEITTAPMRQLCVLQERRSCWGSERFGPRSISRMAQTGSDPRQRGIQLPFRADVERVAESCDTLEHGVIRGFLDFLDMRAVECRENLEQHVKAIEKDRPWRHRSRVGQPSLYEVEDLPRLSRLHEQLRRTEGLRRQIRMARQSTPLRNARSVFQVVDTPVFRNVGPYNRFQHEMVRYLRTGLVVLDEGADERIKSTARMYEQWLFLQVAAAIRSLGLQCQSRQGLLHTTRKFRFTLDIDRGARLTFGAGEGRAISLRYEPWILPEDAARHAMETVYRGRTGQTAWSPDVLLELLVGSDRSGDLDEVQYAAVLDAKYSREIKDHHWDSTHKYLEVRSTRTRRQVVRQLWLVYPGESDEHRIAMRDATVSWSASGPSCPQDETVQGTLALVPSLTLADDDREMPGWIQRPEPVAVEFVAGLLNYLGIRHRRSETP